MHKLITFSILAILSFSFISCNDDDDDRFDTTLLPEKIEGKYRVKYYGQDYSVGYSYKFFYDEKKRLIKWTTDNEETIGTIIYENDKITQYIGIETKYAFVHEKNKIKVTEMTKEGWFKKEYTLLIDNKSYLTSIIHGESVNVIHQTTYGYSRGNMIKSQRSSFSKLEGKVVEKRVYEETSASYDNKAGIFRNVNTPQWFMQKYICSELSIPLLNTSNNILEYEKFGYAYDYSLDKEIINSKEITIYDYNEYELDYPTQLTSKSDYYDHYNDEFESWGEIVDSLHITYKSIK